MSARLLLLFAVIPFLADSVSASESANLLTTLPDWSDENAAYASRSEVTLVTVGDLDYLDSGRWDQSQLDLFDGSDYIDSNRVHADTEGDDLWAALMQRDRLQGIQPNTTWVTRTNNLRSWFINEYVPNIDSTGDGATNNYDHLYGWGACEYLRRNPGDTALQNAIDSLLTKLQTWDYRGQAIGSAMLPEASDGRRMARNLRFAVAAHEVRQTSQSEAWRDRVVDLVLNTTSYDTDVNAYVYDESANGYANHGLVYADGWRGLNAFHWGTLADGMWHAWRTLNAEGDTTRAALFATRLVRQAEFYLKIGTNGEGLVGLFSAYNKDTPSTYHDSDTGNGGAYAIDSINNLVFAYKFTGSDIYLDTAWDRVLRFHFKWHNENGSLNFGEIGHYVDTQINRKILRHNKGELQYMYALFENQGNPSVVGGGDFVSPAPPTNLEAR